MCDFNHRELESGVNHAIPRGEEPVPKPSNSEMEKYVFNSGN